VVLEARSRAYVEDRVRAGVLEQGTVDLMAELGLDRRLRRECMIDEAIDIRFGGGKLIHVHFPELVAGKVVTIYGQQEVVKDLIAARIADGAPIEFEAEVIGFDGSTATGRRSVTARAIRAHADLRRDRGLRRLSWRLAARDSGRRADQLRSRVSVRLARHPVGIAADQGDDLRQSRPRLCAVQPP
jgi:2-polyprenyl-6-methoxyphenol hydroxylase-like FAD-dependent oxidoreductase